MEKENWLKLKPEIENAIKGLRDIDGVPPQEIAQRVIELSAWLASVNSRLIEAQFSYNLVARALLEKEGTAAKASLIAAASPEWKEWQELNAYSKSIVELIRAGRRFTKLAEEEQRTY